MVNPSQPPKIKILLVDDDPETRELIKLMLANSGHRLLMTGTGRSALAFLEHEKVDLILLDIMMPDIDGLMVLENVRKVSEAPILMITALSDPRIMEQSYLLGADDYLVKPFSKSKLLDRIDRLARQLTSFVDEGKAVWTADYQIDHEQSLFLYRGLAISMNALELGVLARLMDQAYTEVELADLYEAGWGGSRLPSRTMQALVESTVESLRQKIEQDPSNPKILLSSEKGYMFTPA